MGELQNDIGDKRPRRVSLFDEFFEQDQQEPFFGSKLGKRIREAPRHGRSESISICYRIDDDDLRLESLP